MGTTVLLVTHDLGLAAERADRVVVMNKGEIVERGPVSKVMHEPDHPYTQLLLDSIPQPDPDLRWTEKIEVDRYTDEGTDETATIATTENIGRI